MIFININYCSNNLILYRTYLYHIGLVHAPLSWEFWCIWSRDC